MKKFMKVCGITVATILTLSLILLVAGGCGGGIKAATDLAREGGFSIGKLDLLKIVDDYEKYDINSESTFNSAYDIIENQDSYSTSVDLTNIKDLEFSLGGCEVVIAQSEDQNAYIHAENVYKMQVYTEGAGLHVIALKTTANGVNTMKITIELPAGILYEDVEMDLGAGSFTVENLQAQELEFNVGAGALRVSDVTAGELTCNLGAGEVIFRNTTVSGDVEFATAAGSLEFDGSINGDLEATCSMGSMIIDLDGNENDHNYELVCVAGSLNVAGEDLSGIAGERIIDNDAATTFVLTCTMGDMEVNF